MNPSESHATGRKLAKIGAWMQLALLIGVAGSVIGMMRAFDALEAAAPGVGDPTRLSAAIGNVLWSTLAGIVISFIGGVLICIALLSSRYRARWLFWFLILDGFLNPLGLFFIAFALIKRHEFFPEELSRPASLA
jgi:biopolymer transport protein ExbB/TolQ